MMPVAIFDGKTALISFLGLFGALNTPGICPKLLRS